MLFRHSSVVAFPVLLLFSNSTTTHCLSSVEHCRDDEVTRGEEAAQLGLSFCRGTQQQRQRAHGQLDRSQSQWALASCCYRLPCRTAFRHCSCRRARARALSNRSWQERPWQRQSRTHKLTHKVHKVRRCLPGAALSQFPVPSSQFPVPTQKKISPPTRQARLAPFSPPPSPGASLSEPQGLAASSTL